MFSTRCWSMRPVTPAAACSLSRPPARRLTIPSCSMSLRPVTSRPFYSGRWLEYPIRDRVRHLRHDRYRGILIGRHLTVQRGVRRLLQYVIRQWHHNELGIRLRRMQPLRIRNRHLHIPTSLHDEHGLADRADRRRWIERGQRLHERKVDRYEQWSELRRHVLRLLAAQILRHRGVVADQYRVVELPRELLAHHHTERSAQTGHADHPRDRRTLARCDQGQRRSFAVSQQHDFR